MKNYKKICLSLLLIFFLVLVLGSFSSAEGKDLEIQYPQVPGAETPTVVKTPLPQYVKYIFNFGIWIAGFVAFLSLIYGGIRYLTSVGDPSKTGDAKDQIFAGILGLVVLFASYIILANLNPQLLTLRVNTENLAAPGEIIGVYLCKGATQQNCTVYESSSDTLAPAINDNVGYIYFKNNDTTVFGAVLHENGSRQGTCKVFLSDGPVRLPNGAASSITIFQQSAPSGEGVTLFECGDFRTDPMGWGPFTTQCQKWGPYQSTWNNGSGYHLAQIGRSIKITEEGKYLAVLFQGENNTQKCEVFNQSDPDLASNYIGDCGNTKNMGCFTSIIVLPIK